MVNLLRLIWDIIKTIGPFLARKFPWGHAKVRRPDRRELKSLERLVKTLGEAQLWVGFAHSEMIEGIQDDLNRIQWNIWIGALPYIAINSRDEEQRCLALRNLSQVQGQVSMKCAEDTVKGIVSNKNTPDKVKRVAKSALEELKDRQRLEGDQASSNGSSG